MKKLTNLLLFFSLVVFTIFVVSTPVSAIKPEKNTDEICQRGACK